MKKRINWNLVLTVAVCLIPFIISAVFYEQLPQQVAVHFDFNGNPNNYVPKLFVVLGLPSMMLCFHLFVWFVLENDPKKTNTSNTLKHLSKWLIPIVAVVMQTAIITYAIGIMLDWSFYIMLFIGVLIIVIGNYLPKCRQNYTMGIKLPWTLSDEDNWNKTHRMAGYLWTVGGFILILCAFIKTMWLVLAVIAVIALIPAFYSYSLYRKKQ